MTIPVAAIIVNYIGWQDTIACLWSLLGSGPAPRWIVIVDNKSPNDSVASIMDRIASGSLETENAFPRGVACSGAARRPLRARAYSPRDASEIRLPSDDGPPHVLVVANGVNAGYAGGNNIGLRFGLRLGAEAFWILNNDTVVEPGACGALWTRLNACARPGLAGGHVCYFDEPGTTQCCGGGYTNRWTLLSRPAGHLLPADRAAALSPRRIEKECNFIYGACVMAGRKFVEDVGFMDEGYFLYCEEQDWAWRAAGRFDLAYAPNARVYHKEGMSTRRLFDGKTYKRFRFLVKSRLRLAGKHAPYTLPTVCLGLVFAACRLPFRSLWRRAGRKRSEAR
jgi:GT2 family glycosyltransferase